ncbi:hypothetical protein BOTNAR_0158g00080 [Botryotinia narcissicola]|uniref:Uncharacterized protein n=1 Tax=Botryotinia narcissicola TaxID=278944 RepID=A0A4Z1IGN3_9HELO|nr:hypothetical protein BOTNAR_0158g00080 [Botryotinia narcissicola]
MQHDPNESPYDGTPDIKVIGFLPCMVCAAPDLNRPGSSKVWYVKSNYKDWRKRFSEHVERKQKDWKDPRGSSDDSDQ